MQAETATPWTFPTAWEAVAQTVPDRIAQVQGNRRITWRDFDRRAAGIAATLLEAGLSRQDKVALYLHNAPEYLEAAFAAMKAALVPVNTNYRYTGDELRYLWTNADAAAVVFHGSFVPNAEAIRALCPAIRLWLHVDDGSHPCPSWAIPYEPAAATPPRQTEPSGDDLILIYTGGTTGLPRGVMWRQHDLFMASNTSGDPPSADPARIQARIRAATTSPVGLPAAPLMHGTGFVFAATILNRGGTVVTAAKPSFDAAELLDTIVSNRVTDLCIVGDAFARPIADALDAAPTRWDLSSLQVISSSGMVWSAATKTRLLTHAPDLLMIDFLNSSEASGLGRSLTSARTAARPEKAARFKLGEKAFVIDAENRRLPPGSGTPGRLAISGHLPLGYYKDPEKTAATFPLIDGLRCSIPGDYALVEADGSITLLGRGSLSINTGGEKVFPDEVEAAIKTFPGIRDAIVVGLPHERFGQSVAAAVESAEPIDREALLTHLRAMLAGHKIPRTIMPVTSIGRAPNGKADYPATAQRIQAWIKAC